jgi:hypothetical protein
MLFAGALVISLRLLSFRTARRTNTMERSLLFCLPDTVLLIHGDEEIAADADALGNAAVLRKLCSPEGRIYLTDPDIFSACRRALRLPQNPLQLLEWCSAYDLLCATPPYEMLLAAVLRAFREQFSSMKSTEELPRNANPAFLATDSVLKRRGFLIRGLQAPDDDSAHASRPPSGAKSSSRGIDDLALERPQTFEVLLAACEAASALLHNVQESRGREIVEEAIQAVLLGLADTGNLIVPTILASRRLQVLLSLTQLRWLVHRAFMHLAGGEAAGSMHFLDEQFLQHVQEEYRRGAFDLASLLPLPSALPTLLSDSVFLLPGCPGRMQVERLRTHAPLLRNLCIRRHPWLEHLSWPLEFDSGNSF